MFGYALSSVSHDDPLHSGTAQPAGAAAWRSPVVLTGAAGFIGSHVAMALVGRGVRVIGVDNFDPFYDESAKLANVRAIESACLAPNTGTFELVRLDLADEPAVAGLFARQDLAHRAGVIHLAGKAGVRPSVDDPVGYARANIMATSVVLAQAHRHGLKRVVAASSSSVYGNCPVAPFHEELDVSRPISPYAATKRACEVIGFTHHHLTAMPTAMLRFFTVFGPRQRPDLAIALFMRLARAGGVIPVFGDLNSSRDYTFVDDIVDGVLRAYERIDAHGYRIWNLGNSSPVTLRDMLATIERVVGTPMRLDPRPARAGDVERTFADLSRARTELGYAPATSFLVGVQRQWEALCASTIATNA